MASGNEAGNGIHASGMLSGRKAESVELAVGEYESGFNLQLWKNYSDEYGVELIAPSGERSGNLRTYGADRVSLDNTQVYVYYGQPTPYSRYQQLYFEFVPAGGYVTPGVWRIVLTPVRIVDGRYDLLARRVQRSMRTQDFSALRRRQHSRSHQRQAR